MMDTVEIPLSQGKVAIIDLEDYDRVSKHNWHYDKNKIGKNRNRATGYAKTNIFSKVTKSGKSVLRLHRLIMNPQDEQVVDHINGNGLDNRKSNLRLCTHSENLRNQGRSKGTTNPYKGVYVSKAKKPSWEARIRKDGATVHLGTFSDPIVAAKVFDEHARRLHGEFANTNFTLENV